MDDLQNLTRRYRHRTWPNDLADTPNGSHLDHGPPPPRRPSCRARRRGSRFRPERLQQLERQGQPDQLVRATVDGILRGCRGGPDHPLPDPAALTDVLNRLADPNLPGAEKVTAVQGATPEQLDKFTKAIGDAGFSPLSFTVKDPKWSTETPGDVEAVVTINSPSPKMGGFAVPMSFSPEGEGWKLSKRTSDLLLKTGTSLAGTGTPKEAPPADAPSPQAPAPTP